MHNFHRQGGGLAQIYQYCVFFTTMTRELFNGLHLWQFENLRIETDVAHYVSDRNTGGREFTLSLSSTPDRESVVMNRAMLAMALGIDGTKLFFPSQVHGTVIVNVQSDSERQSLQNTDALITNNPGVCISVMSADCVPILLYDKANRAIAAVHSGWRGTVARILEKTLHRMREEFGTRGENIVAGIGPSVSQDSYEVGEEVISEVTRAFGADSGLLISQPPNKAKLDLWQANRLQLLEFGVPASSIEISDLCTVRENDHFFSARKGDAGRFAAGIMLR
jgi:polyphenol oxidase